MKLETFFEKFEQFADAPDAVAKMRELVLELAVKGALSDRKTSDQEDTAWRNFVTKIDQRSCNSETDAEPPFEIPIDWRWTSLDDLGTTRVRNDVEDSTRASFVPMALISSTYGVAAQSEERTWSEIKKGFTHFADGDVVIAKITPCFENAKSAVMRNLVNGVGAGTTELHVFRRGTELVLPDFVLLYVKTRGFITRGEPRMTGSAGQKRVPREYFATSPFPLPPLAEQKRIVAKVDELMELCDRLEAQQQERETRHAALARASLARFADAPTPANLPFLFHPSYAIPPADLRKSILTLAVQGKLVPQDPNDEPAEECLSRLGLMSTIVPQQDDSEDDSLPLAWARVRFEDVALVAGGVTLGRKLGDRKTVTLPYLRVANVKRGEIDLTVIKEVSIAEDEIARYALRENDLLMTEGGDWDKVGRAAIWRAEIPLCLHQNHVFRARMRSAELTPFWLERYFNSPVGRGYFESASKQTTNLASINMRQVRSCPIPLPPLAEQRRIVAKVEQLMALVDTLETQLAASRATAANLLSALVAELTGTTNNVKVSIPKASTTGRRGRPPKS
jgi:type I restriction enzyme S subunit